jgi:hypothetical protein
MYNGWMKGSEMATKKWRARAKRMMPLAIVGFNMPGIPIVVVKEHIMERTSL